MVFRLLAQTTSAAQTIPSTCLEQSSSNSRVPEAETVGVSLCQQRKLIEDLFEPEDHVHHMSLCPPSCLITTKCNFKHSWLSNKSLSYCTTTNMWWLVFVEGKGMFCLLCRKHDTHNPQNKTAYFNKAAGTRYRPCALRDHVTTVSGFCL